MTEKIMSRKQLIASGFRYKDYKFIQHPGQFMAVLDGKCWGHNNLLLFFTLLNDNYSTIITAAWRDSGYHGLRNAPPGSKVLLLFKRSKSSGNVYLAGAEVIKEEEKEDFYGENVQNISL